MKKKKSGLLESNIFWISLGIFAALIIVVISYFIYFYVILDSNSGTINEITKDGVAVELRYTYWYRSDNSTVHYMVKGHISIARDAVHKRTVEELIGISEKSSGYFREKTDDYWTEWELVVPGKGTYKLSY